MNSPYKTTSPERHKQMERNFVHLINMLCQVMEMSPPSAVYAVNQFSTKFLFSWHPDATADYLEDFTSYLRDEIDLAELSRRNGGQFDKIIAGYERTEQTDVH